MQLLFHTFPEGRYRTTTMAPESKAVVDSSQPSEADVCLNASVRMDHSEEATPGALPSADSSQAVAGDVGRGSGPVPEPPRAQPDLALLRARTVAQSKKHLMTHTPACPDSCEGCQAKSRNRPHYKHSFVRDKHEKRGTISMDQLTVADEVGTYGIGGYKYAILIAKVGYDYWQFVPLRTFCKLAGTTPDNTVVYCNAHSSLQKICKQAGLPYSHPPPGRPQANAVIERQVGLALQGMRASLATAGLPNCFWPFGGDAFAFNCSTVNMIGGVSA